MHAVALSRSYLNVDSGPPAYTPLQIQQRQIDLWEFGFAPTSVASEQALRRRPLELRRANQQHRLKARGEDARHGTRDLLPAAAKMRLHNL
jgi:hypothetical protein